MPQPLSTPPSARSSRTTAGTVRASPVLAQPISRIRPVASTSKSVADAAARRAGSVSSLVVMTQPALPKFGGG
jgi:hypothetical protein